MDNLILLTDGYKLSHYLLYPPGTTKICSYFESRGGAYERVLFFGLQAIIKKHLQGVVITHKKFDEAKQMCAGNRAHSIALYLPLTRRPLTRTNI